MDYNKAALEMHETHHGKVGITSKVEVKTRDDPVSYTHLDVYKRQLLTRDWYVDVDVSKYAAYFVVALNHDMSVSSIIDPIKKIEALLAKQMCIRDSGCGACLLSCAEQGRCRCAQDPGHRRGLCAGCAGYQGLR